MASSQRSRSVAARLADLEQLVSAQQREIARLRATPAPLAALSDAAPRDERPTEQRRNSRRALLKLGGAAAAAGVAAMAAGASELAHPGTAHARSDTVTFTQSASGWGNVAIAGTGTTSAIGVMGTTDSRFGVYGYASSGSGVYGTASSGVGVSGDSSSGIGGRFSGGRAALALPSWAIIPGAPTSGVHGAGDVYVDSQYVLWVCTADGTPGTWARLTGVKSGVSGGALNYLAAPIRLFDSRSDFGQGVPLPGNKGALAGQSTTTIQVTGTIPVPAGATGVFGNLTVTNGQGGGDLILYPSGTSQPNASNINYVQGQTIANAFNVGLSSGGAMDLFVHVHGTDVIIDIAGYVL